MTQPDTFSEVGLVSLQVLNGTAKEFYTITETVDIKVGNKDFDVINTMAGGRSVKFTPQEPTTITLEAYPVEAGTSGSGTTGNGFFDLMHTVDATQPLAIAVDRTRTKLKAYILWTDDTTVTSATSTININQSGIRIVAQNGYVTSCDPSFTDGVLKWTITMKFPTFTKAGVANVTMYSTDGTATQTVTTTYT